MKKLTTVLIIGMVLALTGCSKDKKDVSAPVQENIESKEEVSSNDETEQVEEPEVTEETENTGIIDEDMVMRFLGGEIDASIDMSIGDGQDDLKFCCVYEEELDGEISYYSFHDDMDSVSFGELYDMVNETKDAEITEYPIVSYGIVKGTSGADAMIIRFDGIGIEGGEPSVYACFVFTLDEIREESEQRKEDDIPFNLVYAFDCWSKHYVETGDGLTFKGSGTNGAGDSIQWIGKIDEHGKYRLLYSLECIEEDWVAMYAESELDMETDNYEWSRGSMLNIALTCNGDYFSYKAADTVDKEKQDALVKALEDEGMTADDNLNEIISKILSDEDIDTDKLREFTDFKIYGDPGFDDSDIPSSFVEESAGKTSFDSYDDLISYLKPGEAYAYVKLLGADEQVLFITDQPSEINGKNTTNTCCVYLKEEDGKVTYGSGMGMFDTGKPIAESDGIVYVFSDTDISTYCIAKETGGLMCKDYIYKSTDENGNIEYSGYTRKDNSVTESDEEWIYTDSDEVFEQLVSEYNKADIIEFTVIK